MLLSVCDLQYQMNQRWPSHSLLTLKDGQTSQRKWTGWDQDSDTTIGYVVRMLFIYETIPTWMIYNRSLESKDKSAQKNIFFVLSGATNKNIRDK